MIWLCSNCEVPMVEADTEDGNCPTCGLRMYRLERRHITQDAEFDLMLAALLYGKKQ